MVRKASPSQPLKQKRRAHFKGRAQRKKIWRAMEIALPHFAEEAGRSGSRWGVLMVVLRGRRWAMWRANWIEGVWLGGKKKLARKQLMLTRKWSGRLHLEKRRTAISLRKRRQCPEPIPRPTRKGSGKNRTEFVIVPRGKHHEKRRRQRTTRGPGGKEESV